MATSPIKATQTIMRHRMIEPTITTGLFIVGRLWPKVSLAAKTERGVALM
jgi:hypothetical protein